MSILVVHLSDSSQKANHCQDMLLKSYQLRREWEQEKSTIPMSNVLSNFIVKGTLIPFKHPLRWECRLWYVDFSKGFLILCSPCQDMLQLRMLPKFLLLSSQNQLLQIVIRKHFHID